MKNSTTTGTNYVLITVSTAIWTITMAALTWCRKQEYYVAISFEAIKKLTQSSGWDSESMA
jgi:hypothetical protein